ncbi:MAG: nitroreductase family protein [Eubacterium sp.]|jgi:putative NAD(P)H nitroreductase|nr:nitroreductase family protein [Eubacterium sp.]
MDVEKIIKERRSAKNFIEGEPISREELNDIFELVRYAPSCFNLQHAKYIVITDPLKKDKLMEAAFKQYKIHTASAAILVLGNKDEYLNAENLYEGMLNLNILNKQEYDMTISTIHGLYKGRGDEFKRDEAIRNACLSAMLFMLAAKDKGWETCPMIGFDPDKIKNMLGIPDNLVPALLITLGKADPSKQGTRGYRKPTNEFVEFV